MVHFKGYLNNLKRVLQELDHREDMLQKNMEIHENIDKFLENEIQRSGTNPGLVEPRIQNLKAAEKCIEALDSIDGFLTEYGEKIKGYDGQDPESIDWEKDLRGLMKRYNEIISEVDEYQERTSALSEKGRDINAAYLA